MTKHTVSRASLTDTLLTSLSDDQANDIVEIDLRDKSSLADAMVIASGRSQRHVGAIAAHLVEKLKALGLKNIRIEGMPNCDWVLIDAYDVVVHIFRPEVRSFYNLEKLWQAPLDAAQAHVDG